MRCYWPIQIGENKHFIVNRMLAESHLFLGTCNSFRAIGYCKIISVGSFLLVCVFKMSEEG